MALQVQLQEQFARRLCVLGITLVPA